MPPATLDAAPPLPDAVKSQMGTNSEAGGFAGIGQMLAKRGGEGASPAAENGPQGALKAKIDTIKKVLEGVIGAAGAGKTFFSRAAQLLDQGLAAEAQKGPGTPATKSNEASPPPSSGESGMSAPPAFAG